MEKMIGLFTGASGGFGRLIANALAGAGHIAYASMRGLDGKNASRVPGRVDRMGDRRSPRRVRCCPGQSSMGPPEAPASRVVRGTQT